MSTTEYPRPPLARGLVSQIGSIRKMPGDSGGDGGGDDVVVVMMLWWWW